MSHQVSSAAGLSFEQGGQLLDRSSGVACPRCLSELNMGVIQQCKFAGCSKCGGMLFQQEVFGMLIQHLRAIVRELPVTPAPMDADELKVRCPCPACDRPMETHAYAGPGNSVIDSCSACGLIWLEEGELTALTRAPGRG